METNSTSVLQNSVCSLHPVPFLKKNTLCLTFLQCEKLGNSTYSMQQSPPSDANWFSASQEIPCILWKLRAHYCVYKSLLPVPILSQINQVHLIIILPSMPGAFKWSVSPQVSLPKPFMHRSPPMCYMPSPPHSSLFDTQIFDEYRSLSSS